MISELWGLNSFASPTILFWNHESKDLLLEFVIIFSLAVIESSKSSHDLM